MKPTTEQRRPDRPHGTEEPEAAALDELRKAFGVEPTPDPQDKQDGKQDGKHDGKDDDATAGESGTVDEVTAPTPVTPVTPDAPDAPEANDSGQTEAPSATVIKIDDYAGDVAVEPMSAKKPEPAAPAADRPVISIDADDLPDAVYVEGSLESGGSGSIVFIEDDVEADALTPESDRDLRRGIEPRMRERRMAVKRAKGRRRLKWLIAGLGLVVIGVAALATFGSSLFAIRADEVTITGNVYTDEQRLQEIVDDLVGTPVLVADTQKAERALEAIPWVADAKVTTRFPHGVTIEIRERQAVATYQGPDQRFRVLDRDGRVLDVIDGYPFAYVLITGPDAVDLDPAEVAPQGYQAAAELAKNLTGTVRGRVERIEVTSDGSRLVMWLDDGSDVHFGEARDLFTKLVRLETVLTQNPDREPGPIDVSTSQTTL